MNTKKLLRAILTVMLVVLSLFVVSFVSYKIISITTLGIINLFNSLIIPVIIACIVGFIVLVKVFYELDVKNN